MKTKDSENNGEVVSSDKNHNIKLNREILPLKKKLSKDTICDKAINYLKILFLRIDSSIRICKNSETYSVFKN